MPVVHCPACRQPLTVADAHAGAVVHCPACRQPMTVPGAPPAPVLAAAPDYLDPFAVPDSAPPRPRERDRAPESAPAGKSLLLPLAIAGGVAFVGLVGVVILAVVFLGGSRANPTGKDKAEVAKAPPPRAVPAPKAKGEPVAAVGGRMDDATVARIKKATVYIRITGTKSISSGSGFFIDKNLVVTNEHVISPRGRLEVVVESGTAHAQTYPARIIGRDAGKDLAILEVEGVTAPEPLRVSDTTALRETHDVYVFGFPLGERLGEEMTVTKTTVSSKRDNGPRGREIQLNGGLHPGNSGGPITDTSGRVVGVAVAVLRDTQIHFAIAAEEVTAFLARFHDR